METPGVLVHTKRSIEGLEQSRVAERLEQAFDRTLFDQPLANHRISVSRNEDNRNRLSLAHQFPLKIGPGHPRHSDVEDQTSGLIDAIGYEELFRRRECTGGKAERLQQIGQRLTDGCVVVDHGHKYALDGAPFLARFHNTGCATSGKGVHYALVLVCRRYEE
jgi:hypothetical protein